MFRPLFLLTTIVASVSAQFDIDSNPNAVAACYSVWHSLGYNGVDPPPDITEIEIGTGSYQVQGVFHFWGNPDGGYYQGGNRSVLDRHFSQLSGIGVDFIIIDATNCQGYGGYQPGLFTEPTDILMDELYLQKQAGNAVPNVVYWVRSEPSDPQPEAVIQFVIDRYMTNPSYADLFVTLGGLPLILTTNLQPANYSGLYTLRKMWGLESITQDNEWSFLHSYPQDIGTANGVNEQVCVCVAVQQSYMSDKTTAQGRAQGQTYQTQWSRAFDVHPKVVTLTWWNEWMAQRQADDANGNVQFVDEFDSGFSKDIEPQDPSQPGSHGNNFYTWTGEYIAAYKANQPMPQGLLGGY